MKRPSVLTMAILSLNFSVFIFSCDPEEEQEAILATVTTSEVSEITDTSAIVGGAVTNEGDGEVTERGICYSETNQNPTVENSKIAIGTGIGTFTSSLTSLAPVTTYYVRAYATSRAGTAYGEISSFTTQVTPSPDPEDRNYHIALKFPEVLGAFADNVRLEELDVICTADL